jgi:hypothetical protein
MKLFFVWIGITLLAFPIGGYIGWAVGGHVDGLVPALVGGALTGAGIGLAQWLLLRRDLDMSLGWIAATAVGLSAGLAIGSGVVDYETSAGSLAIMGAISGAAVGIAQGLLLRKSFSLWAVWMIAMPVMWAGSWLVTEGWGIDVDNQFTVFGASGSILFGVLCGAVMIAGKRRSEVA